MRVLVAYASLLGATKGIAEYVGEILERSRLEAIVEAADRVTGPLDHDAFVIGSAIHHGHWLRGATEFVRRNRAVLAEAPVWLFSSGPIGAIPFGSVQPDPKEIDEIRRLIQPRDHRVLAGAFDRAAPDLGRMGLLERTVAKRWLPEGDYRDWDAIRTWTEAIARSLGRVPVAALG
jgi:menaquinone-dependent protoporphyrinogen oxidase